MTRRLGCAVAIAAAVAGCGLDGDPAAPVDQAVVRAAAGGAEATLRIAPLGAAPGEVTLNYHRCALPCTRSFPVGQHLTVTAYTPSTFVGWGGACAGAGSCELVMTGDVDVTARFEPDPDEAWTVLLPGVVIRRLAFAADGDLIAAGTSQRTAELVVRWYALDGALHRDVRFAAGTQDVVSGLAVAPGGELYLLSRHVLAGGGTESRLRRLDAAGAELWTVVLPWPGETRSREDDDIAVLADGGALIVESPTQIRAFDAAGRSRWTAAVPTGRTASDVEVDAAGIVWLVSRAGRSAYVQRFTGDGALLGEVPVPAPPVPRGEASQDDYAAFEVDGDLIASFQNRGNRGSGVARMSATGALTWHVRFSDDGADPRRRPIELAGDGRVVTLAAPGRLGDPPLALRRMTPTGDVDWAIAKWTDAGDLVLGTEVAGDAAGHVALGGLWEREPILDKPYRTQFLRIYEARP